MMAHSQNAVVTLYSVPSGTTLRGYNHNKIGRNVTETVYLPFESEWGIRFKFTTPGRRRLKLEIDGTLVTDDLIVHDGSDLERFIETDKRFRFVPADDSRVGDPTSRENGKVVITLWEECVPTGFYKSTPWVSKPDRPEYPYYDYSRDGVVFMNSVSNTPLSSILRGQSCSVSSVVGATVEGSHSDQKFGSTHWGGDAGDPIVFTFSLRGSNKTVGKKPQVAIRCPYCGTLNRSDADHCTDCPTVFKS